MSDITSTDITATTATDLTDLDAVDGYDEALVPFVAGYAQMPRTRVFRDYVREAADGTGTVRFVGTVDLDSLSVSRSRRGVKVYAEVTTADDGQPVLATVITLALVPTGKRRPQGSTRVGMVRGTAVYLLDSEVTDITDAVAQEDAAEALYVDLDGDDTATA